MAGNINSPIVLDFFGLPGCGKSTVSHLLADKLREKGYRVYELSYDLDHRLSPWRRKIEKMRQYVFYTVLHPVKARKITELVKDNGYTDFLECLSQGINIVTKLVAVKKREFDYIIFDEGFFQAAVSLSLTNANMRSLINLRTILELSNRCIQIWGVHIVVSKDVALKRMEARGESNSRIDAQSIEYEKSRLLDVFDENCNKINAEATYRIDALGDIDKVFGELCAQMNF